MKGRVRIEFAPQSVEIALTLESPADAGEAMEMIRSVARACWPTIVFNDETDSSDQRMESRLEDQPKKPPVPVEASKAPRNYSRVPKPGSASAFVLEACRRLKTTDFTKIADELDLKTKTAASLIAGLRRGGHLVDGSLQ